MAHASVFTDLAKFYEHVSHEELRQAAGATDFDLRLLRGYVAIYRLPRRAVYKGAVPELFHANGTIAAGCSGALALSKLLLATLLRRIKGDFRTVGVLNIVDDVVLQSTGGPQTVASELAGAHGQLLDGFAAIRQPVAAKKTAFLANSSALQEALIRQSSLDEQAGATGVRHLGTDATDGRWRRTSTAVERETGAHEAVGRAQVLREAGADIGGVVRAGPTAKALWGAAVTGIPDGRLHSLRVGALRAEGRLPKGATVGLRFKASPGASHRDPFVLVAVETAKKHAMVVRAGLPSSAALLAVGEQAVKIPGRKAPWRSCRDPIEAFVLTVRRIGWGGCCRTTSWWTTWAACGTSRRWHRG